MNPIARLHADILALKPETIRGYLEATGWELERPHDGLAYFHSQISKAAIASDGNIGGWSIIECIARCEGTTVRAVVDELLKMQEGEK